jgi:parallel beta-helix repeat protein
MFSRKLAGTLGAGIAALGIAAAASPAQAATFTVNNAGDSGGGSLRSAINAAEDTNRRDEILFEIPGNGQHVIHLDTELPTITKPLVIRGYSQPGADPATEDAPATPKIVIDAGNVNRGLDIGGDDVEVRGLVVRDAQADGIFVEGSGIVIAGNHIGTDAAGDDPRPNAGFGVSVSGSGNIIGGPEPEDGNVISGNSEGQVHVTDGTGHVVEGNRLGTDATGRRGLGGPVGVNLESSGNTVRDNQIADQSYGMVVSSNDNVLQGNDVGVKQSGKRKLPNTFGILVVGGDRNLIGGTAEEEGNLLSGNRAEGVRIEADDENLATGNRIEGNLIGTTFTGRAPLPNGQPTLFPAVSIIGTSGNTVGGDEPGAGNVISGNAADGVIISPAGSDGNRVVGNWIGTNKTARRDLGNGGSGVRIMNGDNNAVGTADESGPINRIMHNGEDGVEILSGTGNSVLRNSMTDNGNLAIDLGADGSTANDPNDLDTGANDLQNGPEIEEATTTEVEWELETTPNATYRLEFYACDARGAGEGLTYLGSTTALTDANGDADETTPLPAPVEEGDFVGMTATRTVFGGVFPNLELIPSSTSELSPCEEVA